MAQDLGRSCVKPGFLFDIVLFVIVVLRSTQSSNSPPILSVYLVVTFSVQVLYVVIMLLFLSLLSLITSKIQLLPPFSIFFLDFALQVGSVPNEQYSLSFACALPLGGGWLSLFGILVGCEITLFLSFCLFFSCASLFFTFKISDLKIIIDP